MFGSIKVFDLNDVFVRVFVVEWVVVDFNEGIDVVNVFFGSCDLGDVVFVLGFQVVGFVIFNEEFEGIGLCFIFCDFYGFFQLGDDLLNGGAVYFIGVLDGFF